MTSAHHEKMQLFVLTEASLPRLVWQIIRRRKPVVLFSDALIRPFNGLLDRLHVLLARLDLVGMLADVSSDLPWPAHFPLEKNLTHGALEPILTPLQDAILPKQQCRQADEYAYPMRKAITDYSEKIKDLFLLVNWLEENLESQAWALYGAPKFLDQIYQLYHQRPLPVACRVLLGPCRLINLFNSLLLLFAGLSWLLKRARLVSPKPTEYRLIADRIGAADTNTFRTVIDSPRDLLILDRNQQLADSLKSQNGEFRTCLLGDARVGLGQIAKLAWPMIANMVWLWSQCGSLDPQLYWRFSACTIKRQQFAAFFSQFKPQFFWGRDDYSLDHIVRNQEIRKLGGVTLGINHGFPLNTFASQWREVDFDIYYSFGTHLYDHIYRHTWPKHTKIKPVGTLQMKREFRARLAAPRPKDIAFFPIVIKSFAETFEEAFKVAAHFSDRKFFIKMKPGRKKSDIARYHKFMSKAPKNVIAYIDPSPYELLLNVSYGICFTTLVAEALQFKVKTFNLDMDPTLEHQYYRNFPGLTVPDGETIIKRIEAIEAGTETYGYNRYNDLIAIDGPDIFDVIRSDIGLQKNAETMARNKFPIAEHLAENELS